MAWVYLTDDAKDDVRKLDNAAKRLVLRAMRKLEDEPDKRGLPLGSRASSNLTSFRKLVVGDRDYRIVYRSQRDGSVAVVWVVGTRADGEVYELAMTRLRLRGDEVSQEIADVIDGLWNR